jgi:hypothetical protein
VDSIRELLHYSIGAQKNGASPWEGTRAAGYRTDGGVGWFAGAKYLLKHSLRAKYLLKFRVEINV